MSAAPAIDRLRLARTETVGPVTWRRLLETYGTAEAALAALPAIARAAGRSAPLRIPSRSDAAIEMEEVRRAGARMLFLGDATYPGPLALLADAPPVITVLGDPAALQPRAVALVGARNASTNGQRMARALASELAAARLVVVSGMARGIDAAAHEGALEQGMTIAATAGGIDQPYPAEHAALQARIAARGCVVSEAPFGTSPQARHFPRRNRIIAGLSLGIVVVEAALRSGSLITAGLGQDAGREIFAVPGSPLDPRCQGSNDLLRQGAHLTELAADVLANLPDHPAALGLARDPLFARPGFAAPPPAAICPPGEDFLLSARNRAALLRALGYTPAPIDLLVRSCGLSTEAVLAGLVALEIAGRVQLLPGNQAVLLAGGETQG